MDDSKKGPVHLLWDPLKTNRFAVGSNGTVRLYAWEAKVSQPDRAMDRGRRVVWLLVASLDQRPIL